MVRFIAPHEFRHFFVGFVASVMLAPFLSPTLHGQTESEEELKPSFGWRQTETSIALLHHGQTVWQHVHDRKTGKPYMRIGLLDGTELTRPCPIPDGYSKPDHPWHRALWWSWKAIDGINFWEQNQPGNDPIEVEVTHDEEGAARIGMTIAYHLPDEPPIVLEQRVIAVGPPDRNGSYLIDWQGTFTPAAGTDVVFNQNSYGGLAIRMAAELCGEPETNQDAWTFLDSEGRPDCNNQRARWAAYRGTAPNGRPAGIAIMDHPANPRHPSWWQARPHYPYLNPSFTCMDDYHLPAGASLTLRYGVLVYTGSMSADDLEAQWRKFADSTPSHAAVK